VRTVLGFSSHDESWGEPRCDILTAENKVGSLFDPVRNPNVKFSLVAPEFRECRRHAGLYFELTRLGGPATSGVIKDVMAGGYQEVEIDFVADNPGLTLFRCHEQLHMDFGFMALFEYV
jgi:hypothetical protein